MCKTSIFVYMLEIFLKKEHLAENISKTKYPEIVTLSH